MANHIIFTGFMGSGKTTLSIRLSYKLRVTMVDTDKRIEQLEKRTITEIFAQEGEAYFRAKETEVLQSLLKEKNRQIISLGGGTVLRKENREILKQLGTVIYLDASPETVYERLKDDTTRPLLQGENPKAKIETLLQERLPIYKEAADLVICVDHKNSPEIIEEIMKALGEA